MRLKGTIPGLKSSKSNISKSSKKSQKGRKLLEPVYELQANTKSAFVEDDDDSSEKYQYKSAVSNYSRKMKSNHKSFDDYHHEHRMSYTDCESENSYGDGFSLKFVASEVASTTTMPESLASQPIIDGDDFQDPGHSIEYETDDLLHNIVDGKNPKLQLMGMTMTNENTPNDENCGVGKWCSPLNILQMQSTMTTKTSYYSDVSENKHTLEKEDEDERKREEDRCTKLNDVENKDPSAPPSFYGTWLDIKSKLSVVSSITANSVDGNETTLKCRGEQKGIKDHVKDFANKNSFDNHKDDESFEETLRVRFNNFVRYIGQNCSDEMKPIATNQDETWLGETPRHRNVSKMYEHVSTNKKDVIDYSDNEVQQTPLDVLDFLDSSLNSVSSEHSKSQSQELKPYIHHVDENDTEAKRAVGREGMSSRSRRSKSDRNQVTRTRSPSRRNARSSEPSHTTDDTKSSCSKSIESSPSQSRRNKSVSQGITTSRSRSPARRLKASKQSNETENMKSSEKKKSTFRSRLGRSRSPSRKLSNTASEKKQGTESQSLGSRSNRSGRSRSPSRKISNSVSGKNVGTESQSIGSKSRSGRSSSTSRKMSNTTGGKSQGTEIQSVGSKSNRSGRSRSPSRKVSSSMFGNNVSESHGSKSSRSGRSRSRSPSRKMSQGMPRAGRSPSRRSQKQ